MKGNWNVLYLLTVEIIFGALVIFPYYTLQGLRVPLLNYFLIMVTSCIAFIILLEKAKNKGKMLFFMLIFPAILFFGYGLGFPIAMNLLICLFVFWRTLSHTKEQDKQNEGKWLLLTLFLGITLIYFAALSNREYMMPIVGIMLAQIAFIIIGGFMKRWLEVKAETSEKKQFFLPFFSVIAFISLLGLIITAGMNLIKSLFFFILKIGVSIFAIMAKPFFDWAESKDWSEQTKMLSGLQGEQEDKVVENNVEEIGRQDFLDPTIIITVLFIASLIILFIYIYKRNKAQSTGDKELILPGFISEAFFFNEVPSLFREGKGIPPANSIRKEIYAIERFAKKLHLGREPFESFSDWMNRVGMKNYHDMNSIYEKVRYGAHSYSEKEAADFKYDIQIMKQELRKFQKKRK